MPSLSKREIVVDAAIDLFKQHGINRTGVDAVVDAANVSKKTLYNHFQSKEELVLAALRKDDERGRNGFMQAVERSSNDPIEKLLKVFDMYKMWFERKDFKGCFFINSAAELNDKQGASMSTCKEHKVLIESYLIKLASEAFIESPEKLARQLNILLEGATVYAYVMQDISAIDSAKDLASTLIGDCII